MVRILSSKWVIFAENVRSQSGEKEEETWLSKKLELD